MPRGQTRSERDAHQGYRFSYLARKYGLSHEEARKLIERFGHDRAKLNEAGAALLRQRQPAAQKRHGAGARSSTKAD